MDMVKRVKRVAVADLCGTFYDSRRQLVKVENLVLAHYGKPPITEDRYMQVFSMASRDALREFYASVGVPRDKLDEAEKLFRVWWNELPPPPLIPGAKEAFERLDEGHGKNVYVVTNEVREMVEKRFERDGLERYLSRAHSSPPGGKAAVLFEIAQAHPDAIVAFVGDTVSDGRECLRAREMGSQNLRFVGILHP